MDWYTILFNVELVIFVLALVAIAFDDKLTAWERRVISRIRRHRKSGVRCTDGKVVGYRRIPTAILKRGREG